MIRNKTNYLLIHHSVSSKDTTVETIDKWHKERGFGGIGYHYLINSIGIHEGRPEDQVGAHCKAQGKNFDSLGICVAGNYNVDTLDDSMRNDLLKLLSELTEKYDIAYDRIKGHRDYANTACPGNKLYNELPSIREDLYKYNNNDMTLEEAKKVFVSKRQTSKQDKDGSVWEVNHDKKLKWKVPEDQAYVASLFVGGWMTDEERGYQETKEKKDVLS